MGTPDPVMLNITNGYPEELIPLAMRAKIQGTTACCATCASYIGDKNEFCGSFGKDPFYDVLLSDADTCCSAWEEHDEQA